MMNDAVTASRTADIRNALAAADSYLHGRQSRNGAFCFYRCEYLDEPNLGDTYYAVAALGLLGVPISRTDEIAEFVRSETLYGADGLYLCAFTLDRLGRAEQIDDEHLSRIKQLRLAAPRRGDGLSAGDSLHTTLRALRLKDRFAALDQYPNVLRHIESLKANGGYGAKPNLQETYLCLSIRALLGADPADRSTRDFVDDMQQRSLGFRATRDSWYTNLDVLFAGVSCCELLGQPVRHVDDIVSFVLCCQTSTGGFSRAPAALPDIELTYRALRILQLLGLTREKL